MSIIYASSAFISDPKVADFFSWNTSSIPTSDVAMVSTSSTYVTSCPDFSNSKPFSSTKIVFLITDSYTRLKITWTRPPPCIRFGSVWKLENGSSYLGSYKLVQFRRTPNYRNILCNAIQLILMLDSNPVAAVLCRFHIP